MTPTRNSRARCGAILRDYLAGRPADVRPGITAEDVARDIIAWSRRQPSRLSKSEFDCLAADSILASWDDTDAGRA